MHWIELDAIYIEYHATLKLHRISEDCSLLRLGVLRSMWAFLCWLRFFRKLSTQESLRGRACVPPLPEQLFFFMSRFQTFDLARVNVSILIDKPFYWWNDSLTVKWLLKNDTLGAFWRPGRRWDSRASSARGCIKAKTSIESIAERASRMTWWVIMGDARENSNMCFSFGDRVNWKPSVKA